MLKKNKKNILYVLAFAAIFYFILIAYFDFQIIQNIFLNYSPINFAIVLILILISLVVKFYRWHYYLNCLNIDFSFKYSVLIFLSGLLMAITPGKVGEILKVYVAKNKFDVDVNKLFSVVFAERVIEFVALIFICGIGILLFTLPPNIVMFIIVISTITLAYIIFKLGNEVITNLLKRIPIFKKNITNIEAFSMATKILFNKSNSLKMLSISFVAWCIECFGLVVILYGFVTELNIIEIFFNYAFSMFAGAVSMLPGGIGASEGSLIYLLIQNGFSDNIAVTSSLIIRIATLWFSVIVGFIAFFMVMRNQNNINVVESGK